MSRGRGAGVAGLGQCHPCRDVAPQPGPSFCWPAYCSRAFPAAALPCSHIYGCHAWFPARRQCPGGTGWSICAHSPGSRKWLPQECTAHTSGCPGSYPQRICGNAFAAAPSKPDLPILAFSGGLHLIDAALYCTKCYPCQPRQHGKGSTAGRFNSHMANQNPTLCFIQYIGTSVVEKSHYVYFSNFPVDSRGINPCKKQIDRLKKRINRNISLAMRFYAHDFSVR